MQLFRYSYKELQNAAREWEQQFPGRLKTVHRAVSSDGRMVTELRLGDESAAGHVLIHAGMHGREYLNTWLLMRLVREYLQGDVFYRNLCLHILPMVNPDGCIISQSGPEKIASKELRSFLYGCYEQACGEAKRQGAAIPGEKQYFSRWKANGRGVDLNRNFASGWESCQGADVPGAEGYKGRSPGSEREIQSLLSIHRQYPLSCCVSYHSSGNLIYWDYGSRGTVLEEDRRLAQAMGEMTGYPLYSTISHGAAGAGCSDYFVLEHGIPAVTIETGEAECPLPPEEFEAVYYSSRRLFHVLAELYEK